jgi:hypothetical protein
MVLKGINPRGLVRVHLAKGQLRVPAAANAVGAVGVGPRGCRPTAAINWDAGIISLHGWGHPGTSRGAEARNCRNPEAESRVLANAQTGLRCDERSREARTEIEGNHG